MWGGKVEISPSFPPQKHQALFWDSLLETKQKNPRMLGQRSKCFKLWPMGSVCSSRWGPHGENFKTNNDKPPTNCETQWEEKTGRKIEMDFSEMEADAPRARQKALWTVVSVINNVLFLTGRISPKRTHGIAKRGWKPFSPVFGPVPVTSHALCHHPEPTPSR